MMDSLGPFLAKLMPPLLVDHLEMGWAVGRDPWQEQVPSMVPRSLNTVPVALPGLGHEAAPPQPRCKPGEIKLLTLSSPPPALWHHTWEKPTFSLLQIGE